VVGLRNEQVEIAVIPELGAKVSSLVDRRTGRQWMWAAPEGPRFARVATGTAFSEGCLLGADECIPSIAPCAWRGIEMADHGEVWTQTWALDRDVLDQNRIVTRVQMPVSPLRLGRAISLNGTRITLAYELQNFSDDPFEYLWAFHPMMTLKDGDRLELPGEVESVRIDAAYGCPLGVRGDRWGWPVPMEGMDFSSFDLGPGDGAVKFYTEPLTTGWAAAVNDLTGERITFEFDVSLLDTIGVWINRGGWAGYQHFAIEPTDGAPDALDVAVGDWKRFKQLPASGTHSWSFTITVGE